MRSLIEAVVFFLAILSYIWDFHGHNPLFLSILVIFLCASFWHHRASLRSLGLAPNSLGAGFYFLAPIVLGNVIVVLALHFMYASHSFIIWRDPVGSISWYLVWALIQQLILCGFFVNRFWEFSHLSGFTIVATAFCFGAVHFPNPVLMILALINGAWGAYFFLRYRNIYLLACSHVTIASCAFMLLPASWHHMMKIGHGFYLSF